MGLPGRVLESWRAFVQAFRNPALRRLQLAGAGSTLGIWAYSIGIAVYAYRADGAKAVGIVLFVRWSLGAVAAPWLALLADRMSRRRLMLAIDFSRAALVAGMTAAAALGGPPLLVYALAVVISVISTGFGPAEAALLPSLAATPEELTASNLALNTISGVGMFAGPALGGLALAVSGPSVVFALTGCAYLWSGLCVLGVPPDSPPEAKEERQRILPELLAGFNAIRAERGLQAVVGLSAAQMVIAGAIEVLIVVEAIQVLHAGNATVGWLNTALGVGGLVGGLVGVVLAARKRLAADFRLGLVLIGAGLALLAVGSNLLVALLLFGLVGIGNTLVDVMGVTLMQRAAPEEVLGRVFGVIETLVLAAVAVGSLASPGLVAWLGPRESLVAFGLLLPVLLLPTWRQLGAIDAAARIAAEPLELLRAISIFSPLPPTVLERLASLAQEARTAAGAVVFNQGDTGDRFYVIAEGSAVVDIDGEETARLGRGDFFGEIALLRDVPRTATVRAVSELRLFALERDDFIGAVTGHAPSHEAADSVVAERLPAAVTP